MRYRRLISSIVMSTFLVAPSVARALPQLPADGWRADLDLLTRTIIERHPEAFAEVAQEEFEAATAELRDAIPSLPDHRIVIGLARLAAMLGDGHTEIGLNQGATGFARLPIAMSYFGDELRVFAAFEPHTGLVGARVLAIGDVEIAEAHRRMIPLISRDNEMELQLTVPVYLQIPEILEAQGLSTRVESATFSLRLADGSERDVELEAVDEEALYERPFVRARDGAETPLYLQERALFWREELADGTLYVRILRCIDDDEATLAEFADELFTLADERRSPRIVFDLRNNRGGNYLLMRPFIDAVKARPRLNRPGGVYAITDRETFSAAAIYAFLLRDETATTLVGEPSRSRPNGSDNAELLRLERSGLIATYTDRVRVRFPAWGELRMLPVDLPVANTFSDYRDGRDRVLEAILERPVPASG